MPFPAGSAINDVIAAAYRLHADIVAAVNTVAERFGLSAARWQILSVIVLSGDVTVPDLAQAIGTARQSVQRIVSELVGEGIVVLTDNPRHRRATLVRMTARGRDAYDAVMAAWAPHAAMLEQQVGSTAAGALSRNMDTPAATFRTIAERGGYNATNSISAEGSEDP